MAANEQTFNAAGGIVVPRLTSDPSSPSNGAMWYNTTTNLFKLRANGSTTSPLLNPMTTAGDLIYGGSGGSPLRLAVGAAGTVLTSDGSNPSYTLLVNANIASGAAIALNKLAATTANRALVSDGSGFVSASSVTAAELGFLSGVTSSVQSQINALAFSISWHTAVRAYATTNTVIATDLENGDTFQGLTLVTGDRIALTGQTTGTENGIYVVQASGAALRATDAAAFGQLQSAAIFVAEGTFADKGFLQITELTSFAGQVWTQITGTGTYVADEVTLTLTGSTFSVKTGGISNTQVNAAAAIAYSKLNLTGSIVNADINASAAIAYSKLNLANSIVNADVNTAAAIAYSKLALTNSIVNADINTAAAIAYSKLNLTGSIVNADVNAAAAIAYSKLNLAGSIVNADIATGAAIAYSKLAALTASRVLVSDGSGFVSVSSRTSTEVDFLTGGVYVTNATLTASQTSAVLANFTFAHGTYAGETIDYKIKEATTGRLRVGRLLIVSDGTTTSITDTFTETADVGVTWDLNINGANTEVRYTTTANNKSIYAAVRLWVV